MKPERLNSKRAHFLLQMVAVACLCPSLLRAAGREAQFQIQQSLENRITPLIRVVDPTAMVFVKLRTRNRDSALPATPFTLRELAIRDSEGDTAIERVDIVVLSQVTKFPKAVMGLVRDLASGLGPVNLKVKKLPQELAPAKEVAEAPKAGLAGLLDLAARDERALPLFLLSLEIFFAVAAALLFWAIRRGSHQLQGAIQGGFSTLASSLETVGGFSERGRVSEPIHDTAAPKPREETLLDQRVFVGLPDNGLLALMADCYWAEFDSYAAYIWKRIPVPRRTKLISQLDFLSDYTTFLVDFPEQSLGAEQEPYYLSPLPITHLDNKAVTEMLKQNPALRFHLPSLRMAGVNLTARERVELTKAARSEKLAAMPDFQKLTASTKRLLKMKTPIPLANVEEEREILSLPDLSLDMMESIPTLGWWLKAPREVMEATLGRYSAKELASAWIAPEEVLHRLAECLPKKKLDLLNSYRMQIAPSRQSLAFQALHRASIEYLAPQSGQPSPSADPLHDKAVA